MRTGCRVAAPMCATARWSIYRSRRARSRRSSAGRRLYQVKVSIGDVNKARWKMLCTDCSGGIDSLVELLQGRFSKGVMERICRQDTGLFPRPSEIRFTCSCPDYASMCKHIAAVLYGVGARLDESPELLFRLRAVDETELLSNLGSALSATQTQRDAAQTLAVTISRHCSVWTWRRVRHRPHARPMRHRPASERKRPKAWL